MAFRICLLAGMFFLLQAGLTAQTRAILQTADPNSTSLTQPPSSDLSTSSLEKVPRVPGLANLFRGVNVGVNYSGVHSSANSWYSILTPALNYAFSSHYSADVSSSLYFKRQYLATVAGSPPTTAWVDEAVDAGDTLFGLHATYNPRLLETIATFTVSAPTGSPVAGLGTGHTTYDFTDHVEHFHRQLGIFLDAGAGNSSVLFDNIVDRNYSTLGGLAHFTAGAESWFGSRLFLESLIYEQLPFGAQKAFDAQVVQSTSTQSAPSPNVSSSVNEDNGVLTYLGIPLSANLTLSGYYSRSLRRDTDTVAFGFTWVMRGRKVDSMVDKALEEAEKPAPPN